MTGKNDIIGCEKSEGLRASTHYVFSIPPHTPIKFLVIVLTLILPK